MRGAEFWKASKELVLASPLVKTILSIVDGLIKMIGGVIGTITGVIGDLGTMAGQLSAGDWKGAGKTALKMTALGEQWVSEQALPSLLRSGLANKSIDEWMKPGYDMFGGGISKSEQKLSKGAGEGLGTVLTFGGGNIAKAIGMGIKGASRVGVKTGLSTLGSTGESIGNAVAGEKLAELVSWLTSEIRV